MQHSKSHATVREGRKCTHLVTLFWVVMRNSRSVFTKQLIRRLIKCTLPVKWPIDYSCGLFWFFTISLRYVCFTLSPQTYRDEVAAGVCNESCFIFRSERGHEVPLGKHLVPDLLPEIQWAQMRHVVISHLLCDCRKGYLYYTTSTEHYRTTDRNRYETTLDCPTSLMHPHDFKKYFLLHIKEMLSEMDRSTAWWRSIGENSIIDFLLDGIVEVTLVIIPTLLVYYHTAHPVTGPFDFQMSYKALCKRKFTGRCFGFDEVFWGRGRGGGG